MLVFFSMRVIENELAYLPPLFFLAVNVDYLKVPVNSSTAAGGNYCAEAFRTSSGRKIPKSLEISAENYPNRHNVVFYTDEGKTLSHVENESDFLAFKFHQVKFKRVLLLC
jgi:hypothetical protein